jgi:hypothetical protein
MRSALDKNEKRPCYCLLCKVKQTLVEVFPMSSNSLFHDRDGTGTTENPEATKTPIHSPYPNPPLHHPFIQK